MRSLLISNMHKITPTSTIQTKPLLRSTTSGVRGTRAILCRSRRAILRATVFITDVGVILCIVFSLITSVAMASTVSWSNPVQHTDVGNAFKYQNQSIDPLCLDTGENKITIVNLAHCGFSKHTELKPSGKNKDLIKSGFIGTDYTQDGNSGSYSYYRIVGNHQGAYVLQTISSGGGSGTFRGLILVKRHNDHLSIQNLAAGDRCMGGVKDASLLGDTLRYRILITPAEFIELSKQNVHGYKGFSDLRGCAACCIGTASLTLNLNEVKQPARLSEISLDKMIPPGVNAAPDVETCFDKAVIACQKHGKYTFNLQELAKFMHHFNQTCAI